MVGVYGNKGDVFIKERIASWVRDNGLIGEGRIIWWCHYSKRLGLTFSLEEKLWYHKIILNILLFLKHYNIYIYIVEEWSYTKKMSRWSHDLWNSCAQVIEFACRRFVLVVGIVVPNWRSDSSIIKQNLGRNFVPILSKGFYPWFDYHEDWKFCTSLSSLITCMSKHISTKKIGYSVKETMVISYDDRITFNYSGKIV